MVILVFESIIGILLKSLKKERFLIVRDMSIV